MVDRRRAAYLLALALGAAALTVASKGAFALPRPAGASTAGRAVPFPDPLRVVYVAAATGDGYGFPSGHALGAVVVWGGAATVLDVGAPRTRYAVAGTVAALVALSRVVLGVHFAVDVVAGLAAGLCYLAVADRVSGRGVRPGRAFSLAVVVALAGPLLAGFGSEPVALLGAALGARVAWGALGTPVLAAPASRRQALANLAVGLPVLGVPFGLVHAVEPAPPLAFVAGALALAGLLVAPLVGARLRGRPGR